MSRHFDFTKLDANFVRKSEKADSREAPEHARVEKGTRRVVGAFTPPCVFWHGGNGIICSGTQTEMEAFKAQKEREAGHV